MFGTYITKKTEIPDKIKVEHREYDPNRKFEWVCFGLNLYQWSVICGAFKKPYDKLGDFIDARGQWVKVNKNLPSRKPLLIADHTGMLDQVSPMWLMNSTYGASVEVCENVGVIQ